MAKIVKPMAHRNRAQEGAGLGRDISHDYKRTLGAYIAALRKNANLTQEQMAKQLGVQQTALSAIEVGRNPINPERYEAFAKILGVDPQEFGKQVLRWSDPWLYKMVYNSRDRVLLDDIASANQRHPTFT